MTQPSPFWPLTHLFLHTWVHLPKLNPTSFPPKQQIKSCSATSNATPYQSALVPEICCIDTAKSSRLRCREGNCPVSAVRDRQNINREVRMEYVKNQHTSQMTGNSLILLFYTDYCSNRSNSSFIGSFPISNSSLQRDLLEPGLRWQHYAFQTKQLCAESIKKFSCCIKSK